MYPSSLCAFFRGNGRAELKVIFTLLFMAKLCDDSTVMVAQDMDELYVNTQGLFFNLDEEEEEEEEDPDEDELDADDDDEWDDKDDDGIVLPEGGDDEDEE